MSETRDPERDQQLPVHNDNPFIHDLVAEDLMERKEHGSRKYGTPLQANNGRSMLQDAYEESLDLCVYLKGRLEEERKEKDEQEALEKTIEGHIWHATRIPGLRRCMHSEHNEEGATVCWKADLREFMRGF